MKKLGVILAISLLSLMRDGLSPSNGRHYGVAASKTSKYDLRKNLKYYELLSAVDLTHHIVKRGANPSNHPYNRIKELQFRTLGREFLLILNPNHGIFHSQFKAFEVGRDGSEVPINIGK